MKGRRKIFTDYAEITSANVVEVLNKTLYVHNENSRDIEYLYDYYRGIQPILNREKQVRSEINNRIVENRANEIVSFKVGYLMGEAVQYVNRSGDESVSEAINTLNEFVFAEDKASKDKELAEWFTICGTAYRMVLPDPKDMKDESPFEIYTLDPRSTYVVYHTGLGEKPVMAVKIITTVEHGTIYSVYTENEYFEIVDNKISRYEPHTLGIIPIVEYPANTSRLGAFEIVLPLLDAINEIQSNRIDGIEQFIQAVLVLEGMDADADDVQKMKEDMMVLLPMGGKASYLVQELNQTQTQTIVDYMYNTVLTICGMPSTADGNTADSSNNGAVILKNGWQGAEARAKDTELEFKKSEKQFLRLAIKIANTMRDMNLKLSDIAIRFTRRNYENIMEKAQVLTMLLSTDKVHPKLAFEHSGMFIDPEVAYTISKEYYDLKQKELENMLIKEDEPDNADSSED